MAAEAAKLKKIACEAIDNKLKELHEVSQKLWDNPELGLEEYKAHDLLTNFLEKEGFPVQRKYVIDTAFRSTIGANESGPHVAVLCEYDALPEIGHACGHNLIAEVGVGAGIGIKAALDSVDGKLGKLSVLGSPGEEGFGGKVFLIKGDAFSGMDVAMMVHPKKRSYAYHSSLCRELVDVTYKGKASHAAGFPWEGVNALDAAVMAYNNVSALRQQMKPSWRVHGVFTNGGAKPNIIPEVAALQYYVRAPKMAELLVLKEKMIKCFEGAAQATGCQVEMNWNPRMYQNMITNDTLAQLYTSNAVDLGIKLEDDESKASAPTGSTDMGNVSHVVPSIHPMFYIGTLAANHTRDFTTATGDPKAQPYTIKQAKALAMTAIDVLCNPQLVGKMKAEFDEDLKKDSLL